MGPLEREIRLKLLPTQQTQSGLVEDDSTTGATPNHLRAQFTSEKLSRLRVKAV